MAGTDPRDELRAVLDEMTGYLIEANRRVPGGNKDWGRCIERAIALLERAAAAGARDETALLDAAARYQDAWRVLAAGDATDEEKQAHIYDMLEAREDLFDATEVALRAGGADETAEGGR